MSYPTLEEIKEFLGITTPDDDDYLTMARAAVIDALENYCQRKFELLADVDHWMNVEFAQDFFLARYPMVSVEAVIANGSTLDAGSYKFHAGEGKLALNRVITGDLEVQYTGGFDPVPPTINWVIYHAVRDAYGSKDVSGTAGAVKSERLDGVATLTYFEESSDTGGGGGASDAAPIIAVYASSLDPYMSDKAVGAMF